MSIQQNPEARIQVEWVIAPEVDLDWHAAGACIAAQEAVELPPVEDEEWWPGQCIP